MVRDDGQAPDVIVLNLVTPYGDTYLGQHWFRLLDSTKPLPKPVVLTSDYWGSLVFAWEEFYSECPASILYNKFET